MRICIRIFLFKSFGCAGAQALATYSCPAQGSGSRPDYRNGRMKNVNFEDFDYFDEQDRMNY
mgnify:CR=1 FL=1